MINTFATFFEFPQKIRTSIPTFLIGMVILAFILMPIATPQKLQTYTTESQGADTKSERQFTKEKAKEEVLPVGRFLISGDA